MLDSDAIETVAAYALLVSANAQNEAWPVPSPCVSVCEMSTSTGLCLGCFRNLDEIRVWGQADDAFKRRVWADIEVRLVANLP